MRLSDRKFGRLEPEFPRGGDDFAFPQGRKEKDAERGAGRVTGEEESDGWNGWGLEELDKMESDRRRVGEGEEGQGRDGEIVKDEDCDQMGNGVGCQGKEREGARAPVRNPGMGEGTRVMPRLSEEREREAS